MVADHLAQPLQPMRPEQEPQFQRPEPPAERHRPFRIVDDAVAAVGLQEFRLDRQRAHQVFGLADEMHGAVELRAQPFVRIEDDRIRFLDARPEMPELRADHRRAGPGRVDMQVEPVLCGDGADGGDVVGAADAGAADAGDDAGRQKASGADPAGLPPPAQPASSSASARRSGSRTRLSSPMPDTQIARSIEVWTWSEQ